jgi:hypothetical protein
MSKLILLSFDDREINMRCPVCGTSATVEVRKFTPHVMFKFYRHHVIGHMAGKH